MQNLLSPTYLPSNQWKFLDYEKKILSGHISFLELGQGLQFL